MSKFFLQDRVHVLGKHCPGTIAFIGNTNFAIGMWFGVILDEAIGRNNGSYGGVQYFKCPKNHGVFVRPCQVTKITADSNSKASKQNLSKNYPDYLRDASTSNSKKKSIKTSRNGNLNSATRKNNGELSAEASTNTEMVSEEKCVLLDEHDKKNKAGYGGAHYFKRPKKHENFIRPCQVTKIPAESGSKPSIQTTPKTNLKCLRNASTSDSKFKSKKNSRNDIPLNSVRQKKHGKFDTDVRTNVSGAELVGAKKRVVGNDIVKCELSKGMENNCETSDFESHEDSTSKNNRKQSSGIECLSPELQHFFSKTHKDVTEIKDYVIELDEKLRLIKDKSDKEGGTSVTGDQT